MKIARHAERVAVCLGAVLLLVWAGIQVRAEVGRRQALERFARAEALLASVGPVDQSLWSEKRIAAYRESLEHDAGLPLGVLTIPRLGIEVPVFDGTDDVVLDRAVGRVPGTARPGELGNVGIAGHRDGFFRGLKDIAPGDVIELKTLDTVDRYVVDETSIVSPDEVGVLDDTVAPAITLVTCYPFYYAGSAPERFIVRALRTSPEDSGRELSAEAL